MQTDYAKTFDLLYRKVGLSHGQRSKANQLGCARRPVQATVIKL